MDAYFAEVASIPSKYIAANGFYTALPFTTSAQNATTALPFTTSLALSSSLNNNVYAFTTTSTDFPWSMPISYVNPDPANYTNSFSNYQCFTTSPPSRSPSLAPSQQPSAEPTVAPNIIITLKPTTAPSLAPSKVRVIEDFRVVLYFCNTYCDLT